MGQPRWLVMGKGTTTERGETTVISSFCPQNVKTHWLISAMRDDTIDWITEYGARGSNN